MGLMKKWWNSLGELGCLGAMAVFLFVFMALTMIFGLIFKDMDIGAFITFCIMTIFIIYKVRIS